MPLPDRDAVRVDVCVWKEEGSAVGDREPVELRVDVADLVVVLLLIAVAELDAVFVVVLDALIVADPEEERVAVRVLTEVTVDEPEPEDERVR